MWSALLVLSAGAAILFFAVQQLSGWNCQYVTAYLALGCFVCLGAIRLIGYGQRRPQSRHRGTQAGNDPRVCCH